MNQRTSFKADIDGTAQRYVTMVPEPFNPAMAYDVLMAFDGHGSYRWQFTKDMRDKHLIHVLSRCAASLLTDVLPG